MSFGKFIIFVTFLLTLFALFWEPSPEYIERRNVERNKEMMEQNKAMAAAHNMIKSVGYKCDKIDNFSDRRDFDGSMTVFCDDLLNVYEITYNTSTSRFSVKPR
ncbi:hypothetical protein [Vibrio metschnikovii]|uniref:hypothetical protein n=1 Tax=Vibrio metschnikovii TaxID=28172 RepID=UPI001C30BB15|nr:hypothetical protein [Vibrio metschnikovii]